MDSGQEYLVQRIRSTCVTAELYLEDPDAERRAARVHRFAEICVKYGITENPALEQFIFTYKHAAANQASHIIEVANACQRAALEYYIEAKHGSDIEAYNTADYETKRRIVDRVNDDLWKVGVPDPGGDKVIPEQAWGVLSSNKLLREKVQEFVGELYKHTAAGVPRYVRPISEWVNRDELAIYSAKEWEFIALIDKYEKKIDELAASKNLTDEDILFLIEHKRDFKEFRENRASSYGFPDAGKFSDELKFYDTVLHRNDPEHPEHPTIKKLEEFTGRLLDKLKYTLGADHPLYGTFNDIDRLIVNVLGGIKDPERAARKIVNEKAGKVNDIRDTARSKIRVDELEISFRIKELINEEEFHKGFVEEIKPPEFKVQTSGYFYAKVNMGLWALSNPNIDDTPTLRTRVLSELQIIPTVMDLASQEYGHLLYEVRRPLEGTNGEKFVYTPETLSRFFEYTERTLERTEDLIRQDRLKLFLDEESKEELIAIISDAREQMPEAAEVTGLKEMEDREKDIGNVEIGQKASNVLDRLFLLEQAINLEVARRMPPEMQAFYCIKIDEVNEKLPGERRIPLGDYGPKEGRDFTQDDRDKVEAFLSAVNGRYEETAHAR